MGDARVRAAVVLLAGSIVLTGCGTSAAPAGSASATASPSVLTEADVPELGPWSPPGSRAPGVDATASAVSERVGRGPGPDQRFAGVWIAKDGQSVGVAIVDRYYDAASSELSAWLAAEHPGVDVRMVRVARSRADLSALQKAVYAAAYPGGVNDASPDVDAVGLVGTGTLVVSNRVLVRLLTGHHDLAARLEQQFGDSIVVVEGDYRSSADGASSASPT